VKISNPSHEWRKNPKQMTIVSRWRRRRRAPAVVLSPVRLREVILGVPNPTAKLRGRWPRGYTNSGMVVAAHAAGPRRGELQPP